MIGQLSGRDFQPRTLGKLHVPDRLQATITDAGVRTLALLPAHGLAAKASGRWQAAYRGQADMEVPPDLAQALATNPAAAATFERLDAANRYVIVYRLNSVKRQVTRDRKLAEYVEMLARGESLHPRKARKE